MECLDGRAIALTDSGKPDKPYTLKRDQIEALAVGPGGSSVNDEPWTTNVTFIVRTDQGRYAIRGAVRYRIVEERCAFYGFEAREVAKQ